MAKKKKAPKKNEETVVKSGVGVIVVKDNKILVGIRKDSHGEGILAFPGGHLHAEDPSLAACGEREVMEETGILCKVFSPDHYREDLFTTFNILSEDGTKVYVTPYLVAEYLHGGTLAPNESGEVHSDVILALEPDKCRRWQWVTLDELVAEVRTEKQKTWIPVDKVAYYLKQMWGEL